MIYSPKGLMRYNDSDAIVDDIPLLSQWIKKSKSEDLDFLVGAGGFEPPKSKTTDLQSAPFGHSGTLPDRYRHKKRIYKLVAGLEPVTC